MTLTDEQFAATLRTRVEAAAPAMALDVRETVRVGSRRRRSRRLGGALGAVAAVAAAGALALGPLGGLAALRVPVAQAPVTIGTGQVAELAPGITATNALTETTSSDGSPRWDTGLGFAFPADGTVRDVSVGFTPLEQAGDGIGLAYDDPTGWALPAWGTTPITWSKTSGLASIGGTFELRGDQLAANVMAGAVPTWVRDPHVLLYAEDGLLAADGTNTHWLEVPTVRDPQGSDRLIFAVVADTSVLQAWSANPPRLIAVAGDGSRLDVSPVCGSTDLTAVCLAMQPDGGEALTAAVRSVGGTAPASFQPPVVAPVRGVEAATGPVVTDGNVSVVGTLAGTRVVVDRLADDDPDIMQITAVGPYERFFGEPDSLPLGEGAAVQTVTMDGGAWIYLLVAPRGWVEPRVFVWSTEGWPTNDGRVHAAEVPTITLPVEGTDDPGRRFAVVSIDRPRGVANTFTFGAAFASSDGELVVPGCATRAACPEVPYDELRALLDTDPDAG